MLDREIIPELVDQLSFLSDEKRQVILKNYLQMDDFSLRKIHEFLTKAIEKQNSLIDKKISENPLILSRAKNNITKKNISKIRKMEEIFEAQEFQKIKNIEKKLEKIAL